MNEGVNECRAVMTLSTSKEAEFEFGKQKIERVVSTIVMHSLRMRTNFMPYKIAKPHPKNDGPSLACMGK